MPNWYERTKGQEPQMSRYTGTMSANIQVPAQEDKKIEQDYAYEVLNETLRNATPSSNAGVDISIHKVEPYSNV